MNQRTLITVSEVKEIITVRPTTVVDEDHAVPRPKIAGTFAVVFPLIKPTTTQALIGPYLPKHSSPAQTNLFMEAGRIVIRHGMIRYCADVLHAGAFHAMSGPGVLQAIQACSERGWTAVDSKMLNKASVLMLDQTIRYWVDKSMKEIITNPLAILNREELWNAQIL